jgi:integrase
MTVSVRVAHSRSCANSSSTSLKSAGRGSGCTCKPSYYTFHRAPVGGDRYRPIKGKRVKDLKTVQESAKRIQRDIDAGRVDFTQLKRITFPAWLVQYEHILEAGVDKGDLKPRTQREYVDSLRRAQSAIGHVDLRQITATELQRVDDANAKLAAASRARHLKQLSVCLSRAVDHGYLDTNPVPRFMRTLKLSRSIPKRGKAPFEDGELARLWTALEDEDALVYRYVSEFSVETGMRIGELAALDWHNVSLADKSVKVEHTWNDTDGLLLPKDREQRTIYLTPQALAVLERWVEIVGVHTDGPVFRSPDTGGRLSIRAAQRRFGKAMKDAGIPKEHPQLGLKRSFHSLRYTTSNVLQRRGFHPRFIESMLGHSTLELTYGVYGGWTPDQLKAEAARSTGS